MRGNIAQLMQQAQKMQENLQKAQEELAKLEVTGSAGGGMVSVTLTGAKECRKVRIDPSILGDAEMTEDLVAAAFNDASNKIDAESKKHQHQVVLPYNASSHHIIDADALAKMKPSATLVNIARGGIVDELALADALANGRLAAAGLDVFEGEPTVRPELLALHNIVLTPHIGSASQATRRAMVQLAVDNLTAALGYGPHAGNPPSAINAKAVSAAAGGATAGAKKIGHGKIDDAKR